MLLTDGLNLMPDFDDDPPEGFRVLPVPADVVPFDDIARRRRSRSEEGEQQRPAIVATPYVWVDPENIPLRDWLYGRLLVRRFQIGRAHV